MKKLLLCLLAGLLFGLAWNALYNYVLSPDFRFWNRCAEASEAWAEQIRAENDSPCIVFGGGSETRTTIDPAYARERYGLRLINGAGQGLYGGICNAAYAESYLRSGDTLVFPLQAYNMAEAPRPSGLRFLFRRLGAGMFDNIPCSPSALRTLFAGDSLSLSGTIVKALTTGSTDFRYEHDAIVHPSGWMCVTATDEQQQPATPLRLRELRISGLTETQLGGLHRLESQCRAKGCSLVLRLHRAHAEDACRAQHAMAALTAVRAGFRVLKEHDLGCCAGARDFADTNNHLSPEGVRRQMDELCPAVLHKRYWTEAELIRELRLRGWNADGTPSTSSPRGTPFPW